MGMTFIAATTLITDTDISPVWIVISLNFCIQAMYLNAQPCLIEIMFKYTHLNNTVY